MLYKFYFNEAVKKWDGQGEAPCSVRYNDDVLDRIVEVITQSFVAFLALKNHGCERESVHCPNS